jgi:hypothetical protein
MWPNGLPVWIAAVLLIVWSVVLLGMLLLVTDTFVVPNVALLSDIHHREMMALGFPWSPTFYQPLLVSVGATVPFLLHFACLMLPRAAGVQLACGQLVGVVALTFGPVAWQVLV